MITKRMILEGPYVEAFLYFDYLWLFDNDGGVHAFDIAAFVDSELNGDGSAANKLFARNDRLVRPDGVAIASAQSPDVQRLLHDLEDLHLSRSVVENFSLHSPSSAVLRRPLDIRMYNGRAYVSVPGGLASFEAFGREDVERARLGTMVNNALVDAERIFDQGTVLAIQCRLGALSLSCGAEGLFSATGLDATADRPVRPVRTGDVSFGCELSPAGVSSITDAVDVEFRNAKTVVASSTSQRARGDEVAERLSIVSIPKETDEVAHQRFHRSLALERDARPQQTFLSTRYAYAIMSDGGMARVPLTDQNSFRQAGPYRTRLPGPRGDVIAMSTTAAKLIAETDEDVQILDGKRWQELFSEPVLRVRGYPNSRWYKQLVTVVAEDRTELIFLCDE